jgi:HSP20 family protein
MSFAPDLPEPLRLEEFVEGTTLVIRAEMPGIDPDKDVDITVHDGSLRIRATRRCEHREQDEGWIRSEFQYGSFTRVLALPPSASEEEVEAHYRDGILEIRVPLGTESPQARTVPVRRPG